MRKFLLLSSAMGAMIASVPALAQDQSTTSAQASAADDFGADTIIVTARRRAEDVSKVPIAISAFSGEQLIAKGIQTTSDLTRITPGLNISAGGSRSNPFIVLRGQSKAVTGNGSPGVITYMNDVPLPGYGSLIQTYDMENIQVLKGPQGTLFGRNSIGGALLTVTKGATHDFGGYVMGEMASYNFQQIEGALNVPIIKDKVALRVATQVGKDGGNIKSINYTGYTIGQNTDGSYFATPGQIDPRARNNDDYNNKSFRATLLIEPTDWLKNVTVGDYSKIRGQNNQTFDRAYPSGYLGGNPALYYFDQATLNAALGTTLGGIIGSLAQCPSGAINCNITSAINAARNSINDRTNFNTQNPALGRSIIKGITNTTTIRLGDNHQLKNIFAIRTSDNFSNTTLTGLAIPIITTAAQTRLKQTTEEIQLSGSFFDDDLKYTVGGFFYNEKPNGAGGYQALEVNSFFGLSHVLGVTYLHNTSKAAYGQVDYSLDKLIPGLTVTAGLRQTWDTQYACTTNTTFSPLTLGPGMAIQSSDNASVIPSEAACLAGSGTNVGAAQIFPDAKFKKLTYTLGANWQVTPTTMLYVAHRRGYRAGGYNTPQMDPFLAGIQTFRPETLTDWEVGTKLRWQAGGMRGTLDLALFTGKDVGNQLPITTSQLSGSGATCVVQALGTPGHPTSDCTVGGTPGARVPIFGATTTVNAADITIRGVEAAATLSPVTGLTFGGSVGYVDIKVNSISIDPRLALVLPAARVPTASTFAIQGQPKWTVNGNVAVDFPDKILGGDLSASLDYHYNGSYRSVELTVPSWQQFDLRIGLDDIGETGLGVAAYVRNLTDETTYMGTGSSSPSGIGAQSFVLGRSRTVGLQVMYKF